MSNDNYVCAFRGRRDDYQVAVALAESQRLDQFITDAYTGRMLSAVSRLMAARWRPKAEFRRRPEIPDAKVRCLWFTTAVEHMRHGLGASPVATFAHLDQNFSRAAERRARRTRSNLLLYTPYAWEAFAASYRHAARKVLFQYHPHQDYENRLLAADVRKHPEVETSFREATGYQLPPRLQQRVSESWRNADLILCASTFTKKTLLEAGARDGVCHVVPYGIELADMRNTNRAVSGRFRALFVGSGVQRKGLHHLLCAWRAARLPADSELILVCRSLDAGLEPLLARTPRICLIRSASREDLYRLYAESSLFVMPSLTEGFGQVYLEALSQGCPVLGTRNTSLPDLGGETEGVFLVGAADKDELISRLEHLAGLLPNHLEYRVAARKCAERFTWARFRDGINRLL